MWGSGSAGVLCAALALAYPQYDSILRLGFVASFCSKLSDTTASEVGKAYGKTTYNSLPPFNSVPRGTEGAVSLEGTLAGVAASFVFAGVAALLGRVEHGDVVIVAFTRGCGVCVRGVCGDNVRVCARFIDARQKRVGVVDERCSQCDSNSDSGDSSDCFGRGFIEEVYTCVRACVFRCNCINFI